MSEKRSELDPRWFYYLAVAKRAAREAGEILQSMLHSATVHEKSTKDLVTDADIAAQQVIENILLREFPGHAFVGEEEDALKDFRQVVDVPCWVVDPIDGTANYVHRLNNFSVSIALVIEGHARVGVVYDPMANEMFAAVDGHWATLNDCPIRTSECLSMSQALIAASFPPNVHREDNEVKHFLNVLEEAQSIRRLGSAALNLCFVAAGRLDGYWANAVRPWDVAAGTLIAQRAGAYLTARDGSPFALEHSNLAVAANKQLHEQLVQLLK